jgi:fructose-1,6-bisphosphatase/inositol monophosphatase family enzyme
VGEIVRAVAAEEILPRYEKLERHEINEKKAGEIVTAADIASETKLSAALTGLLPGSVVVGEEGFAADETIIEHLSRDAAVWIIDPLDGTRNFAEGRPIFAVIIALAMGGETQAGWIYDPLADDLIWGAAGEGTWDKSGRVHLPAAKRAITAMRGSVPSRPRAALEALGKAKGVPVPNDMVRLRCCGREYMDLIRGNLDFALYGQLKAWDHAAGVLLHREAGGHSGRADNGKIYRPGPMRDGRYILAADHDHWMVLRDLLAEALA